MQGSEKALVLYFSGTGNTWIMASEIGKELSRRGIATHMAALEQLPRKPDFSNYTMVGLGFPVYAWCFPSNVRRFLERLPRVKEKRAFVFSTMQDESLGSEALAGRYLARKGFKVAAARPFLAPNNETIYFGPEDPKEQATLTKLERMKARAPRFVDEILSGRGRIEQNTSLRVSLSQVSGIAFDLLDGYLASRNLRVTADCTACGFCERICPENNIYASLTFPRFRSRCLMCERCVSFCPQAAIIHPLHRAVYTGVRYRAPGYRPPILRRPTRWVYDGQEVPLGQEEGGEFAPELVSDKD
jgi:ferredoxin/flavodoxin